jgi:hypothetical protein
MPKLVVSIPKLRLPAKADDARELYILAFASDLNIKENKETEIIGGANKDFSSMIPPNADKDALKFMLASVSNIFPVSKSFPKASLTGSGIMIYPNLDPGGFFALQMFVIESDDNHKRFGAKLEKILGDEGVKSAVDKLKGAITNPLIGSLMGAVSSVVPKLFKDSSDDLLMSHAHSGFDFDNYGLDEGKKLQDFRFASKHAEGVLRVRVNG